MMKMQQGLTVLLAATALAAGIGQAATAHAAALPRPQVALQQLDAAAPATAAILSDDGANGQNGANGADGADGGSGGCVGANGQAGADGQPGSDGQAGANGGDGGNGGNGGDAGSCVTVGYPQIAIVLPSSIGLPVGANASNGANGASGGPVGGNGQDGADG